jgi:hypothetical protein
MTVLDPVQRDRVSSVSCEVGGRFDKLCSSCGGVEVQCRVTQQVALLCLFQTARVQLVAQYLYTPQRVIHLNHWICHQHCIRLSCIIAHGVLGEVLEGRTAST